MDWLNYHHLRYFWVVAKEGTIAAACRKLGLAQPTISAQIKTLEDQFGEQLFSRAGRSLVLTDAGRAVFRYADEIFSLGQELLDTLAGRPVGRPLRVNIGVADVLPKLVAHRLLEPALSMPEPVHLICHEAPVSELLIRLVAHELHLVLSDSPAGSQVRVRVFSHLLGECGVSVFGAKDLAASYRRGFPRSVNGAPFLLPTEGTALRQSLDRWFESEDIHPRIVAEFQDSALLKTFGQAGKGLFAAPDIVERAVRQQYGVRVVGRLGSVREQFYAISLERKLNHPVVAAVAESAEGRLSGGGRRPSLPTTT